MIPVNNQRQAGGRLVTTCGIMALLPDPNEEDYIVERYNRILENYNGDLRAVCNDYPIVRIFADTSTGEYYAESEDVEMDDPLLKWNNLFHYKFWKPREMKVKQYADMIANNYMANGQVPVLAIVLNMARQSVLRDEDMMVQQQFQSKLFAPPVGERIHYSQVSHEKDEKPSRLFMGRVGSQSNRLFQAQKNAAIRNQQQQQMMVQQNQQFAGYPQQQVYPSFINRDGVYDNGFGYFGDEDTTENFKVTTKFASYSDSMKEFGSHHEEKRSMNDEVGVTGLGSISKLFENKSSQVSVNYEAINNADMRTNPTQEEIIYHHNMMNRMKQGTRANIPHGYFNPYARSLASSMMPTNQGQQKPDKNQKLDVSKFIKKDGEGGDSANFDEIVRESLKTAQYEKPNAFDMLVKERYDNAFKARQKLFDMAKTPEEKNNAMNLTPKQAEQKLEQIEGKKKPEQHQQVVRNGLGYSYQTTPYNYGDYYGYSNYGNDDDWMLPTKEEIEAGKVPIIYTVIDDKPSIDTSKLPKKPEKKPSYSIDDIEKHVCTSFLREKEDGTVYREYYGDKDAVENVKKAAALDYKEAAVIAARKKESDEAYKLAEELRPYNSELADNLLWMRNEDPMRYEMFKVQCIARLIKYHQNDPNKKVEQKQEEPVKKLSMDQIQQIADQQIAKMKANSDQAKVEQKIQEIQQQAVEGAKKIEEEKNKKENLIFKLQAMNDIKVYTADEIDEVQKRILDGLTPLQCYSRDQYIIWKDFMKRKAKDLPEGKSYDEWFDEWWYGAKQNSDPKANREAYIKQRSAQREDHLTSVVMRQPTPQQIQDTYERYLYKAFTQFDGGKVPQDQTLYEFFNGEYGLGYMYNCHRKEQIRKQAASVVKYYDPANYAQMIANHRDARLNSNDGAKFKDIIKSDVYRNKRQRFIESLFKKNPRGMIL